MSLHQLATAALFFGLFELGDTAAEKVVDDFELADASFERRS